jgi:hypothetical protein
VRGKPGELVLEVLATYATANLAVPQPGAPPGRRAAADAAAHAARCAQPVRRPALSAAALPAQPMRPARPTRASATSPATSSDFSDDLARSPRQRFVNRWRLEKKDPAAALSEPVKPITFWLDRNIPVKYRAAITAGVLEWNKAFEKIGFKNAIVVKVQPDDADFDTLDVGAPRCAG